MPGGVAFNCLTSPYSGVTFAEILAAGKPEIGAGIRLSPLPKSWPRQSKK
jgi:hypothetical protein